MTIKSIIRIIGALTISFAIFQVTQACERTSLPGDAPLPPAAQLGNPFYFDPGTPFRGVEKNQHNTVSTRSARRQTNFIINIMLSAHYRTAKPFFIFSNGKTWSANGMNYICENAVGKSLTLGSQSGKGYIYLR